MKEKSINISREPRESAKHFYYTRKTTTRQFILYFHLGKLVSEALERHLVYSEESISEHSSRERRVVVNV